ncbi:cytosolic carboxypeptidase-like protein 5 isoform X2 [Nematostella vectensis]|uniref:cytosolic carboxypeptidase-like protein 5 isoform X1 n=1 Tax=Nematostella vectensis TaxID=45351 RepID=UPI00207719D7|nr:cytosolic carboxypeptidase-like protein 5 isoform X1 [Nematostella vectensis]XP_048582368.1 cytosolic carboxypeptidase-like protein 5 isoform X2 [Nematostella vectensis]
MEERIGSLTFFSNFDSGNLAKVERVKHDDESSDKEDNNSASFPVPDYEFNAWTWPDAVGTEYENLNRTWFYFGVKGGVPGRVLKINMMNLNRQGKLYNQGMSPFVKVVPGKGKWERIRDRPTFETVEGQFRLSFTYRFPDQRNSVHYFAFCYPYSYAELQSRLESLDKTYSLCKQLTPESPKTSIYYHCELLCKSLDELRVDLITLTSCKGMLNEREERLKSLFPDENTPRPHKFKGKKVFFLSARVHPGETPSSFVFEGFLDFLLRTDDPRAAALRDQYIFKMIPMLNPDGVKRGHYRTDPRGVNLNRVYLDPDPTLHPSIFAARSVILYHHNSNGNPPPSCTCGTTNGNTESPVIEEKTVACVGECDDVMVERLPPDGMESTQNGAAFDPADIAEINGSGTHVKSETLRTSGDGDDKDSIETNNPANNSKVDGKEDLSEEAKKLGELSIEESKKEMNDNDMKSESTDGGILTHDSESKICMACTTSPSEEQKEGKLMYYVDLHGHASKRGCFIYANFMENEENYVNTILYPKLVSMNSANFDFTGCVFTEKNMYSKDKRDGMSKEGSGRVGIYKATSIIHSYTLECNYNSGRMLNAVPPATCDSGRATPPPPPGFPPKFTTEIYEEVGRALAIAALDMNNTNPWSRLPMSEFGSVEGVRNWVRRFIKSAKNAPSFPKRLNRAVAKTSSIVAGATATTRQKIGLKSSSSSDVTSDGLSPAAQKITERMTQGINARKEAAKKSDDLKPPKRVQALSVPRRFSQPAKSSQSATSTESNSSTSGGALSDSHTVNNVTTIRSQLIKKDQTRVSMELPKTGPSLRVPRANPPALATCMKALSCPADIRLGGSTAEIHSHLAEFPLRKMAATRRTGGSSASDEDKKKKGTKVMRKNGRKKSLSDRPITDSSYLIPTPSKPSARGSEQVVNLPLRKLSDVRKKSGGRPLLQRSNSNNTTIKHPSVACEVIDITELPRTSHNASPAVAYWVDT